MSKKDLVMLVPDGAYREVLPALLRRARSLSMREIDFHVVFDPFHDSSPQAVELLRPYQRTHRHGIVFRDFEGSGREKVSNPEQLEERLERELIATGWTAGTAHAVVAVPELEDWLRVPSPHFAARLEVVARRRRQDLTERESLRRCTSPSFLRDPLKDVKRAAAERWCAAVNAHGGFGHWQYRMIKRAEETIAVLNGVTA